MSSRVKNHARSDNIKRRNEDSTADLRVNPIMNANMSWTRNRYKGLICDVRCPSTHATLTILGSTIRARASCAWGNMEHEQCDARHYHVVIPLCTELLRAILVSQLMVHIKTPGASFVTAHPISVVSWHMLSILEWLQNGFPAVGVLQLHLRLIFFNVIETENTGIVRQTVKISLQFLWRGIYCICLELEGFSSGKPVLGMIATNFRQKLCL